MKTYKLFTDGSSCPKTKIGFGAFLLLDEEKGISSIKPDTVKIKKFENTSSTRLELETLLELAME